MMNIRVFCSLASHLTLLFKASPGKRLIESFLSYFFLAYLSILFPFPYIKVASKFSHNLSILHPIANEEEKGNILDWRKVYSF